jgi:orotate phosphoribosyltransferase
MFAGLLSHLDSTPESVEKARLNLLRLLQERSLCYGSFILSSGERSDYYLDVRVTSLSADGLALITYLLWNQLNRLPEELANLEGVAGPSVGADPIVSGVSLLSYWLGKPLQAAYIRKAEKKHGTSKQVEGPLRAGQRVVLLEDVITTGGSSLQALQALRRHGCQVSHLCCLVLRSEKGKRTVEEKGQVQVSSIFTAAQLLGK